MKTVLETLQSGADFLEKKGIENGRLNMELLMAHVLGCERLQLYMDFDRPMSEAELAPLRDITRQRSEGFPLQHLLGTVEFMGRTFLSDGRALIPRPETEELVGLLLNQLKERPAPERILDMGTGSGVIGLSLAAEFTDAETVLADASEDALALASANASELAIDQNRIDFVETNLFANLTGQTFDVMVANLPYVASGEITGLAREVQHDPVLALDGGPAGTELMIQFIDQAPAHCRPSGLIALECGEGQTLALKAACQKQGLQNIRILPDLSGIDRFVLAEASA